MHLPADECDASLVLCGGGQLLALSLKYIMMGEGSVSSVVSC